MRPAEGRPPGDRLRLVLLVLVLSAVVVAPALATLPTAHACQPYTYYCVLTGGWYYACGTHVPSPCVMDFVEGLLRP